MTMINKEAAIVMRSYKRNPYIYEKWAFDMAIKALEQEPCDVCKYNPPSSGDGKPCTMCPAESGDNELEQEPFMNKPCVAHQICHEDKNKVLDKIRAEIEEVYINITYKEYSICKATWGLRKAMEIIDKYRAESEG